MNVTTNIDETLKVIESIFDWSDKNTEDIGEMTIGRKPVDAYETYLVDQFVSGKHVVVMTAYGKNIPNGVAVLNKLQQRYHDKTRIVMALCPHNFEKLDEEGNVVNDNTGLPILIKSTKLVAAVTIMGSSG